MPGGRQQRGAVLAEIRQGWGEVGVEADDAASVAPRSDNHRLSGQMPARSIHRVCARVVWYNSGLIDTRNPPDAGQQIRWVFSE
jgi:hypothetical protein